VVDDTLGDEVRVTVIAAGFDRWGHREAEDLIKPDEEIFSEVSSTPADSVIRIDQDPERLVFDAEEDLDVPSFLRNE
ncbi:MAG: cell division protein FtsZ, partial [Actinobacteria bacterium]|nr:cell division protein FtsZ [Actinomycetota bacterium]